MKLNNRQSKWFELGCKMAIEYDDKKTALYAMDNNTLADMVEGTWSNETWFNAGFESNEPEYVSAVRYGEIPQNGCSTNYAENVLENGISCVKIIRHDDDINTKSIYDVTLGAQGIEKIIVNGWYFGDYGSDGEPLLIDAK